MAVHDSTSAATYSLMDDTLRMPPHDEEELGPALAALRNALELDQATVAREAGLPASSISEYERGRTVPSPRSVARILSGMGLPDGGLDVGFHFVRTVRASQGGKCSGSGVPLQGGGPAPVLATSILEILATCANSASLGHGEAPFRRPGPEDRLHAPALWSRLQRYSPKECRAIVQENPEFRSWALCELLCEKSVKAAADSPARAEQLAELALLIASLVFGDDEWRSSLQGYSYAFLGNACRVGGNLRRAEEAFDHSDRLWQAGDNGARELFDEARLLDLKASLRREQRRLPEALDLLNQALRLSEGTALAGHVLVNKSKTLEELNDPEGAVAALREAAPLAEVSADTRLLLCVHFNLLVLLGMLGRHAEADLLAPRVRSLTELLGNALDLVRLRWLEARISAGLGRGYEEVAEALREVKEGFTARGIAYDAALVSLELAVLSLESGRTGEVRQLAREMAPIFQAQGVQRETLAA